MDSEKVPYRTGKNSRLVNSSAAIMDQSHRTTDSPARLPATAGMELIIALAIAALVVLAAIKLEAHEALYTWTQRWETLEIDELLIGMFSLTICMGALSWRRYRQAMIELVARQAVEARLESLLLDNRRLANELIRAQEQERKTLARELHDEMGQYLNVMKLDLSLLAGTENPSAVDVQQQTKRVINNLNHVQRAISGMIHSLRPVGLEELGLIAAVEDCANQWRQRLNHTRITLLLDPKCNALDENLALTTYRLIQEGLTNSIKHAQARNIEVQLSWKSSISGDAIELRVLDDGSGLKGDYLTTGMGLFGMRERVNALGGSFRLNTALDRGLELLACYPVDVQTS